MRFRQLSLFTLACLHFLIFVPQGAHAVRQDNLILSSAVEGQLLDHGRPVAGQRVIRTLHWNMEEEPRTEITTTNKDGRFQFPEVRGAAEFGFLAKLFHVPTVNIGIYVPINEIQYLAYSGGRNSYKENEETGLPQIRIECDLKNKYMANNVLPGIKCEVEKSEERKKLKYD
jgi:hypothetical protein